MFWMCVSVSLRYMPVKLQVGYSQPCKTSFLHIKSAADKPMHLLNCNLASDTGLSAALPRLRQGVTYSANDGFSAAVGKAYCNTKEISAWVELWSCT